MVSRRSVIKSVAGNLVALAVLPAWRFGDFEDRVFALAAELQPRVVAWRRHFHQFPELSNREFATADRVAAELGTMGIEVRRRIAHTGVVGILRGAKSGPAVALRADMDALPVEEKTGLSFASTAHAESQGTQVPVSHACGHDSHIAMLLGAAAVLSRMKSEIAGTVVFIFQPAEEDSPVGEEGGASLMVREGVLSAPACTSIFGLHVWPGAGGQLSYRPGGIMAADDRISIRLTGRQTHGAVPWKGIDLAALVADCVQAINQIAARQIDVTSEPTVISITTINGGNRPNIIPEEFALTGTLRTFSKARRQDVIERVTKRVTALAQSYGAVANVEFVLTAPLTFNDPALTARLLAPLTRAAGGADRLNANATPVTAAEDFAEYQAKIPGVFCFLGATAPGVDPATSAPNHSPFFDVWEPAMEVGVRAHALAALEMLRR